MVQTSYTLSSDSAFSFKQSLLELLKNYKTGTNIEFCLNAGIFCISFENYCGELNCILLDYKQIVEFISLSLIEIHALANAKDMYFDIHVSAIDLLN